MITSAFDLQTSSIVTVKEAVKNRFYQCIICKKDIFLKGGIFKCLHFCHRNGESCIIPESKGESEIHKNAKKRLKGLLENRFNITIVKQCKRMICKFRCKWDEKIKINYEPYNLINKWIPMNNRNNISVVEEFTLDDGGIGDVVLLINDSRINGFGKVPKYVFEVYHTHRTDDRKENWFEISAIEILEEFKRVSGIYERNSKITDNSEKESIEITLHDMKRFYCHCCTIIDEEDWIDVIPTLEYRGEKYGYQQELNCCFCSKTQYRSIWKDGEWKALCKKCVIKYEERISEYIYMKNGKIEKLKDLLKIIGNVA